MTVIRSTDLDFENIKNNLKTELQKEGSPFRDYNFEASGLSNLLDVLALNTHYNGLIANLSINETFLNSAQLRSSVVSHAETLGYYAGSTTAPEAIVNISVTLPQNAPESVVMPSYTRFTGTLGDTDHSFITTEVYTATRDSRGVYNFESSDRNRNISLKQGDLRTRTFYVGEASADNVYVLPDEFLDKDTLRVRVYDSATSDNNGPFTVYTNIENTTRIDSTSRVYLIRETPNGFYEITFGEGNVLGQSPDAGNRIVIEYINTRGTTANDVSQFATGFTIDVNNTNYPVNVTTVSPSAGGSDKESINSIKRNAPIAFASQQRLVTADDYRAIIGQRYTNVLQDIIAWGGEENVPPIYGRVYASLQFRDNIDNNTRETIQNEIRNQLTNNLGIMSIDIEFVEPFVVYLNLNVSFEFDPELSGNTLDTTENSIRIRIQNYFVENLNGFGEIFRQSLLTREIDNISSAILNSSMSLNLQRRFNAIFSENNPVSADYEVIFPVALSIPLSDRHVVESNAVDIGGEMGVIRNRIDDGIGSTILALYNVNTGLVISGNDNIGSYSPDSGIVNLRGVEIRSRDEIRINAIPANQQTIRPLRNYIIRLGNANVTGTIDRQTTEVRLNGN